MDEGKILLVNLSPQLEEPSRLIGAAILGRLLMAAFSRSDTPKARRDPLCFIAMSTNDLPRPTSPFFWQKPEKRRVSTTIANQILEQLS